MRLSVPTRSTMRPNRWIPVAIGLAFYLRSKKRWRAWDNGLIRRTTMDQTGRHKRQRVRVRDGFACRRCGTPEESRRQHDVHHRVPFRTFGYVPGINEHYLEANRLDNLMLVCRTCHQRLERRRTHTYRHGWDCLCAWQCCAFLPHVRCARHCSER